MNGEELRHLLRIKEDMDTSLYARFALDISQDTWTNAHLTVIEEYPTTVS
jgi:hypothetical protein